MEEKKDPFQEQEKRRKEQALKALSFIIEKYAPAKKGEADSFFTTTEISQAVEEHTGIYLKNEEVYELMVDMKYEFEAFNGLELNWLLKKE